MKGVALFLVAASALAQPAFEVASIRQHDGPLSRILGYSASGTRLMLEAYWPTALIAEAYRLEPYEIIVPETVFKAENLYYDVVAKAPGDDPPSRDDFRRMLQTLLADRFQLRFHREPKQMSVFALVAGKGAPKFKPSDPDAKPRFFGGVNGRNQFIDATRWTMADLARQLQNFLGVDRPVIDRTGLAGEYDLRIEATPGFRTPGPGDLSVFTAVQEQLGLRLVPQKAAVEVLVVDRFERPSAN